MLNDSISQRLHEVNDSAMCDRELKQLAEKNAEIDYLKNELVEVEKNKQMILQVRKLLEVLEAPVRKEIIFAARNGDRNALVVIA